MIRLRYTDFLWHMPQLSNLYVIVVVIAMGFTIFAGALGARLTFGHCFFDPLFEWIGWDPAAPMYTSPGYSLLIALGGIVLLLLYFYTWQRWHGRLQPGRPA